MTSALGFHCDIHGGQIPIVLFQKIHLLITSNKICIRSVPLVRGQIWSSEKKPQSIFAAPSEQGWALPQEILLHDLVEENTHRYMCLIWLELWTASSLEMYSSLASDSRSKKHSIISKMKKIIQIHRSNAAHTLKKSGLHHNPASQEETFLRNGLII